MSSLVERLRRSKSGFVMLEGPKQDYVNPDGPEAANEIERAKQALCDARDAMGRAADMMENGLPEVRRNGADLLRRDMDYVRAAIARLQ